MAARKVFIGEDFTVQFTAGVDLTAGSAVIKYRLRSIPTPASKTATITSALTGVFSYEFADTDITKEGYWLFWGVATEADGTVSISEPIEILFRNEGIKG